MFHTIYMSSIKANTSLNLFFNGKDDFGEHWGDHEY